MNNEEKILEMLAQINGRLDSMDGRLAKVEEDVSGLKEDVREVRLNLELKIEPRIDALFDGHAAIMDKLAQLTPLERTEDAEADIDVLKLGLV